MVPFDLWGESFTFSVIYSFIIVVPCILVAFMGRKMLNQLGRYPTKAAAILTGISVKLFFLEAITFTLLIGFYHFFGG